MLSRFSLVRLFATRELNIACQAPLSMGFSRQKYWSEFPCPPPRDLPNPEFKPTSLTHSALAGGFFTTSTTWEAPNFSSFFTWRFQSSWNKTFLKKEINDTLLDIKTYYATATANLLQSCPTLCDPIDDSPPGSAVPGILQTRTLEWVAISFSNAWKWKVKVKSLSCVWLFVTP